MGFALAVPISVLFVLIFLGRPRFAEGVPRCVTCNSDALTPGTPVSSCTATAQPTDPGFAYELCKGAEQCSVSYISGYNTSDYVDGVKMDRNCRNLTDLSMTYYVPPVPTTLLCIKVPLSSTNVRIECFCANDMCNSILTYASMKAMAKLLPFTTNHDPAQYFVAEVDFSTVNASTAVGYVTVKPATYWAGGTTRSYNDGEKSTLPPPTNQQTSPPFVTRFNRTTLAPSGSKGGTATNAPAAEGANVGLIAGVIGGVVVVAAVATGVSVWCIRRHNARVRQRRAARNDAATKRFDAQ